MSNVEFNQILLTNADFLRPFAITLTHDQESAKDLMQETLYRALANKEKYNVGTNIKAWLYTIMRNIFINNYRRRVKQNTIFDNSGTDFLLNYNQVTSVNTAESKLSLKDIYSAIYRLPEIFKNPFLLYFDGYKYHEIADKLNEPLGTIKSRHPLRTQTPQGPNQQILNKIFSVAKKVVIIGSGFAGLSAASFMAKWGWDVDVLEKHDTPGGRARQLKANGFTFDMGPSWYWMPDVFERYFEQFGKKVSDYYHLQRLDPSYRIYWENEVNDIPADYPALKQFFENQEPGAGEKLDRFMDEASYKYNVGIRKLVFKPGQSIFEFCDWELLRGVFKLDVFNSIKEHVGRYFKNPRLKQLMEFPVLFLGALPENTPALYSLMNYADMKGGTWYPQGGMYAIVNAMYQLALELGVKFRFSQNVTQITIDKKAAKTLRTEKGDIFDADVVIGGADYHFIEQDLLTQPYRSYSKAYWKKREMAPSCLIYYVGLNKKLKNILHHSLFFDVPFEPHALELYNTRSWPGSPLFYVSAPSVSDSSVAPEGHENLFFLIPVAAGMEGETKELKEKYFDMIATRFENRVGESIRDAIVFKQSFAPSDFLGEYNSFKGNAYGLANTLKQTALLKPSCRSRKVKNLFFTGQLTVPGPGVPPSLISGEVVAKQVVKHFG